MCNECLVYPALQKFYNALDIIDKIDCEKYIFETIPQLDAFFSEMRNITFVVQKSFNTPELKIDYEQIRDKFFNNSTMNWFKNTRNEISKQHPFKLEKALEIEYYLPNFSIKATNSRLTIDNDYNFLDLYQSLKNFLDTHYSNSVEVFLSTNITFLENGEEVNVYSIIRDGIDIMNSFIQELISKYPCNCVKCMRLQNSIKSLIENINIKQLTFSSDLYYADKELSIGSEIYTFLDPKHSLLTPAMPLKNSIWDMNNSLNCDLNLLRVFSYHHIVLARIQRTQSSDSELMPVFLIIYKNNTYSFYGPITGTNKSTFYRAISNICKIITNNQVKAVLMLSEAYFYKDKDLTKLQNMKYKDRIKEASGVNILFSLVSKQMKKICNITIDYENLFNDEYIYKNIKDIEMCNPEDHTAYPIFQALHS